MMMSFGDFVFSLDTLAYQDLQRQTAWRHPSNSRVGARPARQFAGPGDDTITLSGKLVPEFGDYAQLDVLRAMGNDGAAWVLVDGTGRVYGQYVIEQLDETGTLMRVDGTALNTDFRLQLARVDDDRVDEIGSSATTTA